MTSESDVSDITDRLGHLASEMEEIKVAMKGIRSAVEVFVEMWSKEHGYE